MLEFKSICAEDKKRYDAFRKNDITNASEGSFVTLFLWNEYYKLQLADNGEFLFIRFNIENKMPSYFFPIGSGDIKKALSELLEYVQSKGEKLKLILTSEENKNLFFEIYKNGFSTYADRDCADYVYLTEKMITLSGKKLHSKRNHMNYFFENFSYEYKSVDSELLKECAQMAYGMVSSKTKNKNPYELSAMKAYFENCFKYCKN